MTDAELVEYYKNLLIIQYKNKEKASAHISALLDTIIIFELITAVENGFNIDTAVGEQLNIIGKYLGLQRNPLAVDDDTYRFYLRYRIIQNNSNASLKDIDDLLFEFFGNDIQMYDSFNMTISYTLYDISFDVAHQLYDEGLLPKPAAVGISSVVLSPTVPFAFAGTTRGAGFGTVGGTPSGGGFASLITV